MLGIDVQALGAPRANLRLKKDALASLKYFVQSEAPNKELKAEVSCILLTSFIASEISKRNYSLGNRIREVLGREKR